MDREPWEQRPDHYGTGREPRKKQSLASLTLLLLVLLVGANVVSLAFLMGYNAGQQRAEATTPTATSRQDPTPVADPATQPEGLRQGLAEVWAGQERHLGLILSSQGHILTTAPREQLSRVQVDGGDYTRIRVLGAVPELGLTLLKISGCDLQPIPLSLSALPESGGETLLRCSEPLSPNAGTEPFDGSFPTRRSVGGSLLRVPEGGLSHGDLLLDGEGQLLALCLSVEDEVLALPVEELINLSVELAVFGSADSPLAAGLEISLLDEVQSLYWDLPGNLMLSNIREGSPAYGAGFREGDVILEIGGVAINEPQDLWDAVEICKEQSSVTVKVYRDSSELELQLQLD